MIRTAFAIMLAAMTLASVSAISQAAPIAPLPAGVTASSNAVMQVRCWHCGHRHCWRGPHGHLHCH